MGFVQRNGKSRLSGVPVPGFTLLEILVVIAILAVLATALTLAIGSVSGARQLQRDSERLAALLVHACEQAELTGRDIGLSFARNGYQFSVLSSDVWTVIGKDELHPRRWSAAISAELSRGGTRIAIGDAYPDKPQLACFSSGELTSFQLDLKVPDSEQRYRLSGTANGAMKLDTVMPHAP